jgi:hypothetical protein
MGPFHRKKGLKMNQKETLADEDRALELDFQRYKTEWKAQPSSASAPEDIIRAWPYRAIIALGPEVIPLILLELEKEPDDWFWALAILTGANPVPEDAQGKLAEMTKAWLKWGRDNNYI